MFGGEGLLEGIPEGLAEMPPGAEPARLLAMIDRERLSGYDLVIVMQARHRQVAHDQAELYADIHAVACATAAEELDAPDLMDIFDLGVAEIRAALSLTRRSAEYQVGLAHDLMERLPLVWVALYSGWIDLPKARVIINQTLHLDEETARKVAEAVLDGARAETTGQLRARLHKLVINVDPDTARKRYEQGVEERRVATEPNDDGTANFYGLQLPTQAAMRRINTLAQAARHQDDPRSMDQLRADVFLDLLHGRDHKHGRDRGVIDVRVDLTTLAGLDDNPGEIPGWGPVISDIARQVAIDESDAEWRVTVTDDTGHVVHNGTTRRRPTTHQRRHVESRNPTCVFPGCRMPATDCDLDHNQAWSEGGPTEETNLAPLCRHDHVVKHKGWNIKQTRPGTYLLTSPLGHLHSPTPTPIATRPAWVGLLVVCRSIDAAVSPSHRGRWQGRRTKAHLFVRRGRGRSQRRRGPARLRSYLCDGPLADECPGQVEESRAHPEHTQ